MCPKYYVENMSNEMGVQIDDNNAVRIQGTDVYKPTTHTYESLMDVHENIAHRYHVSIGENNKVIPMISGIPKLHKNPYKMRYLAGARLSSMKNVSILAHKVLKALQIVFRNYCNKISERETRINTYWSINNSTDAIRCLEKPTVIRNLATFDFSTLFTALEHSDIKFNLNWLIATLFDGPCKGMLLAIGKDKAYFTRERKTHVLDKFEVMMLVEDVLDNAFVTFAGIVLKQIKGTPMGNNASPMIADLTLTVMEHRFMMARMKEKDPLQYELRYVVRYIDDILVVNYDDFANIAKRIYPKELILKRADAPSGNKVAFLDLHISRTANLDIDLYDKTRDFSFRVVKFSHISSNVPPNSTYQVFYSQLVRISRIITNRTAWITRLRELVVACVEIGAERSRLSEKFGRFCHNHQNILWKFGVFDYQDRKRVASEIMF